VFVQFSSAVNSFRPRQADTGQRKELNLKFPIPTRRLPERPDLDQLKRQAKELHEAFSKGEAQAVAEVTLFDRDAGRKEFALHHAQLVLARAYGFDSWPKLKAFVDGATISRLIDAVRDGNPDEVRALLRLRPELANYEAPRSHGYTPLHYAVLHRMPEVVRALMQSGADPHIPTAGIYAIREATTPLELARTRGYTEIVAIIREEAEHRLASRPDDDDAVTQLRQALESHDDIALLELLSSNPALAGFRIPGKQWTLLHAASALLLPKSAEWLIRNGVVPAVAAPDGCTPLDVVGSRRGARTLRSAEAEQMRELLRASGAGETIRSAVRLGDVEAVRRFAQQEDLITPRDEDGWLLRIAVDADQPGMLAFLLDLGLHPDARVRVSGEDTSVTTWGMPLYQCARTCKHTMAEMLLKRGADPDGQVYASGTPLSEAFGQADERMIALLERYGGKPNASMAGLYRRPDLAEKLLLEFGDTDLPDDGFSSGPVANQLLGAAARGGDPEILRMALERVDIPIGDPRWNGLLQAPLGFWNHWTGPWCHPEWDRTTYLTCFQLLLEKCGPPNASLNGGATILHQIVAMGDHVTEEERLAFATAALDAGARLDLRDDLLSSTPLGWACRWGRESLVRLFLERGAGPVEPDAEPWAAPITLAGKHGHIGIASILREHSPQ